MLIVESARQHQKSIQLEVAEWAECLKLPNTKKVLSHLHFPLDSAIEVFDVLDLDGGGTLNLDEFVPALLRGLHPVNYVDILGVQTDFYRNNKIIDDRRKLLKHLELSTTRPQ